MRRNRSERTLVVATRRKHAEDIGRLLVARSGVEPRDIHCVVSEVRGPLRFKYNPRHKIGSLPAGGLEGLPAFPYLVKDPSENPPSDRVHLTPSEVRHVRSVIVYSSEYSGLNMINDLYAANPHGRYRLIQPDWRGEREVPTSIDGTDIDPAELKTSSAGVYMRDNLDRCGRLFAKQGPRMGGTSRLDLSARTGLAMLLILSITAKRSTIEHADIRPVADLYGPDWRLPLLGCGLNLSTRRSCSTPPNDVPRDTLMEMPERLRPPDFPEMFESWSSRGLHGSRSEIDRFLSDYLAEWNDWQGPDRSMTALTGSGR